MTRRIPLTQSNIIELLGIESLPLDQREEIVMSAVELVETRMLGRVLGALSDDKKEEFEKILTLSDSDALQKFFEENNINYMSLADEEIGKVKQELLEVAEA